MRLLGPYIFVFVGVIIGLITTYLFKNPLRIAPNIILGILGSFFGLWLRDVLDLHLGGNTSGAILAAAVGALVFTVTANLILNRNSSD